MADRLIAIIGSVHPERVAALGLKNVAQAEAAAEAIGGALARQKCRIVAYSSFYWAVELPVLKGYVTECKEVNERIEVLYSASDEAPHFSVQETQGSLFSFHPDKNSSWTSSFYRSLGTVDGVVLMGGGTTTQIAGTVALSHQKPVLPIARFGGAAEAIWKELAPEPGIIEQVEIDQMAAPHWSSQTADLLVKTLLRQGERMHERRERIYAKSQARKAVRHVYVAVPCLVLALASVPFTWDNPTLSKSWLLSLLLLTPLFAGISGAASRTAFEAFGGNVSRDPPDLPRTCGLGAIAGVVTGALFIIAQLVAMSPEIDQVIWSKQAGRLMPFAALIGFIGGLTLDAVFRRLSGMNVISDDTLKALMAQRAPGS